MALEFADIKTILRSRLDESSASMWTDAELQSYIFLAEQEVLQLLPPDAFFDIQEVEEETEGAITDGYVALPGTVTIQQLVNMEIRPSDDDDPVVRLRVIEPGRTSEYDATTDNPVCWFEDGKLYFYPDIDSAVTQTVKFRYVPAPVEGSYIAGDRHASLVVSFAYALAIEREGVSYASAEKGLFYQRIAMLNNAQYGINKLNRGR